MEGYILCRPNEIRKHAEYVYEFICFAVYIIYAKQIHIGFILIVQLRIHFYTK